MSKTLTVIPAEQLHHVSGGHTGELTTLGIIVLILEAPHIFMGLKEFTNYAVDQYNHGTEVEEGDHFTQFFVSAYQYCFGK